MLNNNFIKVMTCISVSLLFFAVLTYAPSAYAKTQALEDDALAQIEGEAGITLGLNLTVNSVAETQFRITNGLTGAALESITADRLEIGNGTANGTFGIATNVTMDVGTNAGKTWLYLGGLVLPSTAGIGITADNIKLVDDVDVDRTIGSLAITGLYLGRSLTTITPNYTTGGDPWMRISGHSGGLDLYTEMGAYVNQLKYTWNTGGSSMTVSGIYIYGNDAGDASGNVASWPNLTGNARIGWNGTAYEYATVDVGNNGTADGTVLRISMPGTLSIRVKDFAFSGITSFGPLALDNVIFYRNVVTIRNL